MPVNSNLSKSIVHGSREVPLRPASLNSQLDVQVTLSRSKLAIVSDHEQITRTFEQFQSDINSMTHGLHDLGLSPRDNLAIWSYNCYAYVVSIYASIRAGLVPWLLDATWSEKEIGHVLKTSKPRVLITVGSNSRQPFEGPLTPAKLLRHCDQDTKLILVDGQRWSEVGQDRQVFFSELLTKSIDRELFKPVFPLVELNQDHNGNDLKQPAAIVVMTSGSTGLPKAVMFSRLTPANHQVLWKASSNSTSPTDRTICFPLPLHCAFSVCAFAAAPAYAASTVVLVDYKYSVRRTFEVLKRHKCTTLAAVPTMAIDLKCLIEREVTLSSKSHLFNHQESTGHNLANFKEILMSGALPSMSILELKQSLPSLTNIVSAYGTSEAAFISATNLVMNDRIISLDESADNSHCMDHPCNHDNSHCMGHPCDHVSIKIVNDAGDMVNIGQKGHCLIKSPYSMLGYYDDPRRTEAAYSDGWYDTGDICWMDSRGRLHYVSRAVEVINRGGVKIYPCEVEQAIQGHPNVIAVAVFAVPDERLGEEVAAWVQLKPDEINDQSPSTIRAYLIGKIASVKIPHHLITDSEPVPLIGIRKINKQLLRTRLIKKLNLANCD